MNGTAAVADALLRYADRRYTVPGYPVTALGAQCGAELVINEKTALEYALGDSLTGKRAAVIVKHVGINACADPLLQATTQGLVGGVILVAGDDPTATGSQTAQDSRYYGELAEIPVLEPDGSCCYAAVEAALEASEQFSRVAMVRLTPAVLEGLAGENPVARKDGKGRLADRELTMNGRVTASRELFREQFSWSSRSPLNRWHGEPAGVGPEPGNSRIVTVHPPPEQAIPFTGIRETGRSFVCDHRGIPPPPLQPRPLTMKERGFSRTFCKGCPFLPMMEILKKKSMPAICDAGCSILLLNPPFGMGVASYGMGASIAVAARSTKTALIGDYALLHSGINALIDVYEKQLPLLCIVMKNRCAAMIGGHPVPDPQPFLRWAEPVTCRADDVPALERELVVTDRPRTLIVDGICPEGSSHETIAY